MRIAFCSSRTRIQNSLTHNRPLLTHKSYFHPSFKIKSELLVYSDILEDKNLYNILVPKLYDNVRVNFMTRYSAQSICLVITYAAYAFINFRFITYNTKSLASSFKLLSYFIRYTSAIILLLYFLIVYFRVIENTFI